MSYIPKALRTSTLNIPSIQMRKCGPVVETIEEMFCSFAIPIPSQRFLNVVISTPSMCSSWLYKQLHAAYIDVVYHALSDVTSYFSSGISRFLYHQWPSPFLPYFPSLFSPFFLSLSPAIIRLYGK